MRKLKTLKTWNPDRFIFGLPKVELVVLSIATFFAFWLGKDYLPWPLAFVTTAIYCAVRQRQVRRDFNRFKGRDT